MHSRTLKTTLESSVENRRDDVTDVLHGHPIADPYRWLEDSTSQGAGIRVREQLART